jgi:hypothetical protein
MKIVTLDDLRKGYDRWNKRREKRLMVRKIFYIAKMYRGWTP